MLSVAQLKLQRGLLRECSTRAEQSHERQDELPAQGPVAGCGRQPGL